MPTVSGFEKTGIYPYNRTLFTDLDFAPANVRPTDRPDLTEGVAAADVVAADIAVASADGVAAADVVAATDVVAAADVVADAVLVAAADVGAAADGFDCVDGEAPADGVTHPGQSTPKQNIGNASACVSSSDIIPFPKAAQRKTIRGGRKKGNTIILIDTPVRDIIAAATELRKAVEERKQHKLTVKTQKLAAKQVTQPNRNLFSHVDISRKRRAELLLIESSDFDDWQKLVDDDPDQSSDDDIIEGDFVITKVDSKKHTGLDCYTLHA